MENAEVDVALEELENRLERLRALYEQYFMGIERIEPAIPRKDVDRRIYVLRREKIRNTAKRFKLQTIISRYNTFQQYWQRICREIEAGTYKRHVIRAERIAPGKMLTIAARKRMGRAALEAATPESAAARESAPPSVAPGASIAPRPASVAPRPISVAPRPAALGAPPVKPPKPGARPAKPGSSAEPPAVVQPPRPRLETLDLDLDFLGDWDPSASAGKPKRAPDSPTRPFGRALNQPLAADAAGPAARPPKPVVAVAKSVVAPAPPPPPPRVVPSTATEVTPRPPPAPPVAPPAARAAAAVAHPAPPPRPAGAAAGLSKVAAGTLSKPPPPPPKPAATPVAVPPGSTAGASPAPAAAPVRTAPAKPAPAAPKAAPAAAPVNDERVRELHARLLEAKRQTQDNATVSMEGLAKSMKATEAKLREQHKNRKIDFDVVIKDGKAVLKPIVR